MTMFLVLAVVINTIRKRNKITNGTDLIYKIASFLSLLIQLDSYPNHQSG